MGEQAQQLPFRVILQDDGSIKLQGFENQLQKTTRSATKSGNRMTRAFSRIGRTIKSVGRSVFSLKGLLIGLAGGVVLRSFAGLLRAAGQQEDAVNKLNSALRTAGVFTKEFSKQQQQLASSLQAQTRFGDEAILVAQSLLITYGVTTDRLEEATRATLDFAAATGKDLNTAALTIGKAAAGFTGELGRYGIIVDTKAIPATEVFTAVLDKMNEQFGGRAQADVNTFSGRMAQLSNLFGDFREQLGFAVINSARFRSRLKGLSEGLVDVNSKVGVFLGVGIGDALAELVPTAKTLVAGIFAVARAFQRFIVVIKAVDVAVKFLGLGFRVIRLGFVLFIDFIKRVAIVTFVLLAQTIVRSLNLALEGLQTVLLKVGNALRRTEKEGLAEVGLGMIRLGTDVKVASASLNDMEIGLTNLEQQQLKTGDSVRTATRAIELSRIEFEKSKTALNLSQRAFVKMGEAAENAARSLDRVKTAQKQQREAQETKPISAEELRQFVGQDELATLFLQLSQSRAQQLLQDEAFTKASMDKQFSIVKKSLEDEAALRKATRIATVAETANLLGSIGNLLEASGSASFKTIKKFRVAEAIINGLAAVQQALASLPFPANVIAAAAVAAQTAANVAAIRSAQPGGGGGGAAGGGAGAAAGGGGGPAAPGEITPVALQDERAGPANITIAVSGFIGDEGELGNRIVALVRQAQTDGAQLNPVT